MKRSTISRKKRPPAKGAMMFPNNADSYLENHGHDERSTTCALLNVAFEVSSNLLFDHSVVCLLFSGRAVKRPLHYLSRLRDQALLSDSCAAHDNLGRIFESPGALIDLDNRQHDSVFAEMLAVANNNVFDDVGGGAA